MKVGEATELVLGRLCEALHPSEWRRNLRRQIAEQTTGRLAVEADLRVARREVDRANAATSDLRSLMGVQRAALDVVCMTPHRLSPLELRGLLADLPVTSDGALDVPALEALLFEELCIDSGPVAKTTKRSDT